MAKYYQIRKSDVSAELEYINEMQRRAGVFYNVSVLPYRGKRYNPELYVTIKIG